MLDLVYENSVKEKSYNSKFFEKVLVTGVKELGLDKKDLGISINLVGEERIRGLNKKYRNKDKVTDVLSFPLNKKSVIYNSKLTNLDLGDIFICLSFAKKEAKRENVSIEKKLAWLTVHGLLHLTGYDHETSDKDEKEMVAMENKIIQKLKL